MKRLLLMGMKGGTGKSTLAIHLAVAATQAGRRVTLMDTDPQATVMTWGQRSYRQRAANHGRTPSRRNQTRNRREWTRSARDRHATAHRNQHPQSRAGGGPDRRTATLHDARPCRLASDFPHGASR